MAKVSILEGTDEIVDRWLAASGIDIDGIGQSPHYMHKTTLLSLKSTHTQRLDGTSLVEQLLAQIRMNWDRYKPQRLNPSPKNWRFRHRTNISARRRGQEAWLERAITRILPSHWFNQIPTSASLLRPRSDSHRMIDLAHGGKRKVLSCFELKVYSNTPLSAAIQVLRYGLLYVFSRLHAPEIGYAQDQKPFLFDAETVHLRVLAPITFYAPYFSLGWKSDILTWLQHCLSIAITNLATRHAIPPFDFEFWSFPLSFSCGCSDEELAESLKSICPLFEVQHGLPQVKAAIRQAKVVIERPPRRNARHDPELDTLLRAVGSLAFTLQRMGRFIPPSSLTHLPDIVTHLKEIAPATANVRWKCIEHVPGLSKVMDAVNALATVLGFEPRQGNMGAFIKLSEPRDRARPALEQINAQPLRQFVINEWDADSQGFVSSQFACGLLCYGLKDSPIAAQVQDWFQRHLCSDTHNVSFESFRQNVTREEAMGYRGRCDNIEAVLQGKLPRRAI